MLLSIIIPVLNEAACIDKNLSSLQWLREAGHELILVDGGSGDDTVQRARAKVDIVVQAEKGRAGQMNAGAKVAQYPVLVFLHIDTLLPSHADRLIQQALQESLKVWGRFNVKLSGAKKSFRVIERFMNWRTCLTGIVTGDHTMFIRREIFEQLGGFADIPLMEDIEFSKRIKKISRPYCLSAAVITSSRRWETKGVIRTVILMWFFRLAYFLGVPAQRLHKVYYS